MKWQKNKIAKMKKKDHEHGEKKKDGFNTLLREMASGKAYKNRRTGKKKELMQEYTEEKGKN